MPPPSNSSLFFIKNQLANLHFHSLEGTLLLENIGQLVSLSKDMVMKVRVLCVRVHVEVMLGAAVIRWCLSLNMANASFDATLWPFEGSKYRFNLK